VSDETQLQAAFAPAPAGPRPHILTWDDVAGQLEAIYRSVLP
jgi:hypothetical protein